MKVRAFSHVGEWLKMPRVEGPPEPEDIGELARALLWDEQYERAHALAGDLTKFYTGGSSDDWHRVMAFGEWLGIRSALAAVVSNKNRRRDARASSRPKRKPDARPVSNSLNGGGS